MSNKNKISIKELESDIKLSCQMAIDWCNFTEELMKKSLVLNKCKDDNSEWVYIANNVTTTLLRVYEQKLDVYKQKAHESQQLGMANYNKAGSVVYHGENERKYTVMSEMYEALSESFLPLVKENAYRIDWSDLKESKNTGEINVDQYNQAREALGLTPVTLNK
mgnify:CR=1 FL=1